MPPRTCPSRIERREIAIVRKRAAMPLVMSIEIAIAMS
jgi:hypothetical protein